MIFYIGVPLVTNLFKAEMKKSGHEVNNNICPHFAMSRAELFNVVRYVCQVDCRVELVCNGPS